MRSLGLSDIGIGGSDAILYYSLAEQWLRGDYGFRVGDSIAVFRPVLLAFNALALSVFGHTDWAIKLANVLLDGLNILLTGVLALKLTRRASLACASAVLYAALPLAIWSARSELAHTLSTTCALLAYLCAWHCLSVQHRALRLIYSLLCGLLTAAAALCHEELIFLALPLGLLLYWRGEGGAGGTRLSGAYLLPGFLLPTVATAIAIYAVKSDTVSSLVIGEAANTVASGDFFERLGRFSWNGLAAAASPMFAIACALAVVLWPFSRARDAYAWWFCVLTPASYLVLSTLFFTTLFTRNLLPLMPLLLIAVMQVFFSRVQRPAALFSSLLATTTVLAVAQVAAFSDFNIANRRYSAQWAQALWPTPDNIERGAVKLLETANYRPGYSSHWRAIHDALAPRIDADNRLLVTPSVAMYAAGRRALQLDVYLGDNAVYRLDHHRENLQQLLAAKRIRYVVFTRGQSRAEPKHLSPYLYNKQWGPPQWVDLAKDYGMPTYSPSLEGSQIQALMAHLGAREIKPFDPDSFEAYYARVWELPATR